MSKQQIAIINARFRTGLERLRFWIEMVPNASNELLAKLSGLKNANVVASYISKQGLRKAS